MHLLTCTHTHAASMPRSHSCLMQANPAGLHCTTWEQPLLHPSPAAAPCGKMGHRAESIPHTHTHVVGRCARTLLKVHGSQAVGTQNTPAPHVATCSHNPPHPEQALITNQDGINGCMDADHNAHQLSRDTRHMLPTAWGSQPQVYMLTLTPNHPSLQRIAARNHTHTPAVDTHRTHRPSCKARHSTACTPHTTLTALRQCSRSIRLLAQQAALPA